MYICIFSFTGMNFCLDVLHHMGQFVCLSLTSCILHIGVCMCFCMCVYVCVCGPVGGSSAMCVSLIVCFCVVVRRPLMIA